MDRALPSAPLASAPLAYMAAAKPQKAFATAFAVMALALAGCATGIGVSGREHVPVSLARVDDGTLIALRAGDVPGASVFTVRLRSGELVTIHQDAAALAAPTLSAGIPVLVEYGEHTRLIPQNASIGYDAPARVS